jgi:hypothetical protein
MIRPSIVSTFSHASWPCRTLLDEWRHDKNSTDSPNILSEEHTAETGYKRQVVSQEILNRLANSVWFTAAGQKEDPPSINLRRITLHCIIFDNQLQEAHLGDSV